MQIEDLFTPAQQALVASLHRRDQEERQAGSTDPLRLRAVSLPSGPLSLSHGNPSTGSDLGRIRHVARLFYSAS